MPFGKKSKSPTIMAPQVSYSPNPFSIDQFGRFAFEDGQNITIPSPAEATGISLRQSLINELLPEVGRTSDQRATQIQSYSDLFTKTLLDKALPQYKGQYTARGLEGSTAEARGYNDLLTQAITQGIFAGQDLFTQDETTKRANLGSLEGGLQEAFNRLLGISQQGQAFNQQKFDLETANANRQFEANQLNFQQEVARRNQSIQSLADLSRLGGQFFQTGGATSGGGRSSFLKNPNTYLQLAQLASMFALACHVSAVLFDGWFAPQTVRVRNYILFASNGKFRNFYLKHGKQIAEVIKGNKIMKEILRPIFEEMAEKGRLWMEAYHGKN